MKAYKIDDSEYEKWISCLEISRMKNQLELNAKKAIYKNLFMIK